MLFSELKKKRRLALDSAGAITADAERRGQSPTAEEESRFKDFLAEAKTLGLEISEIERRFAENGKTLTDDTDLSTSMGRVSHTELADDGETRRILPGELRLLKPTEKFTAAYPPTSEQRKFSGLNLGKLIGLMAGQPTDGADLERRALTGNQDSLGGVTIPELIGAEIGDMARAKNVCIQAGAVTFLMPNRNVILPRIVQLEGTWKAENATADDADVSFAGCELRARTWFVYIPISNELFSDCSLLDTALRVSIASAVAVAIDGAALFGNGSEQQPTGLYYISEVTKTGADDANGYRDIADSLCRVESENHNPTAVVMSPRSLSALRKLIDSGTGNFIARPDWMPTVYPTTSIPDNLGVGTDESVCISGDFTNIVIGVRNNLTLSIFKEAEAKKNQTVVCAAFRGDVGILRPAAFDVITGLTDAWHA